ncbi:MAG: ATP-grasp domain-containing protein [bacterium]
MNDTQEKVIDQINAFLKDKAIYYLANDPERALSLEDLISNFHIVHLEQSQYLETFAAHHLKYFCLEKQLKSSSFPHHSAYQIIKNPLFQDYFQKTKKSQNFIQTFKISAAFTKEGEKLGAISLNTTALLNRTFENKLPQYQILKDLPVTLPKTNITKLNTAEFSKLKAELGLPLVVQFNRGHTGEGTKIVETEEQFQELKNQFQEREVKISEFINGLPYTLNAVVGKKATYLSGLSYQLTGIPELTPNPSGTVGNDWGYREGIDQKVLTNIVKQLTIIGQKMREQGYLGLFGIDLIIKDKQVYIIEINARQPASVPMFSKIQLKNQDIPLALIHLLEFFQLDYQLDEKLYNERNLQPVKFSQIFQRMPKAGIINQQFKQGIYQNDSGTNLTWQSNEYDSTRCQSNELVILAPIQGKHLQTGAELARIQIPKSITVSHNQIDHKIIAIHQNIRNLSFN